MSSIGFRASPSKVVFALLDDQKQIILLDAVNVPFAFEPPDQLRFIRTTLLDVITEFGVKKAFVRVAESMAKQKSTERMNIEGVLQELVAGASVEKYMSGQISRITKLLKVQRDQFKKWIDSGDVPYEIDGWKKYSPEQREAILSAFAADTL